MNKAARTVGQKMPYDWIPRILRCLWYQLQIVLPDENVVIPQAVPR